MQAPNLQSQKKDWINSQPLSINQLRGKIILLNFFTYSCINCIRTFPAIKRMWQRYSSFGVYVIGIHTSEFEFEKDFKNVEKAIKRHDLTYPILVDTTHTNLHAYEAPGWPHSVLINPQGQIIVTHSGEQGYEHIESTIIAELKKLNQQVTTKIEPESKRFTSPETTPELYTGFNRGSNFGSTRVCIKEGCDEFKAPTTFHKNTLYPHGDWQEKPESITLIGDSGSITICAYAKELYVVLDSPTPIEIEQDGSPIDPLEQGVDITQKEKNTILLPHGADVYNLIRSDKSKLQTIKITGKKGFTIYSFVCN